MPHNEVFSDFWGSPSLRTFAYKIKNMCVTMDHCKPVVCGIKSTAVLTVGLEILPLKCCSIHHAQLQLKKCTAAVPFAMDLCVHMH